MTTYLRYKHGDLVLDDYTLNSDPDTSYGWTQICNKHFNELTYDAGVDQNAGSGICGVKGCEEAADHYLDFDEDDVEEIPGEDVQDPGEGDE